MTLRLLTLPLLLLLWATPPAAQEDADAEPETAPAAGHDAAADAPPAPSIPAEPEPQYKCFVTGAPWNAAPTRVEVVFSERGQLKRARFINLAYFAAALTEFQSQGRPLTIRSVSILDYSTFGSGAERMIELDRERDGDNAWFVLTTAKLRDARPPYIIAFTTEDAADEFIRKHEGRKMSYAKALEKIGAHLATIREGGQPRGDV